MTSTRDLLAQLPPRLMHAGTGLLNWVEHSKWEHADKADDTVRKLTEEIIRLRAHLGRRESYLLDEEAIHPTLPRRSDAQFGHAIHADTCPMCADDVEVFAALQRSADRSEAGRIAYVGGVHEIQEYLRALDDRRKLGATLPTTAELVTAMQKALTKLGERARKAFA
ncbi:hypothetical protein [Micromonospora okii]|uniref:hypothetical protein n=1 Tax=Micromonospora okii TaxID=1182970 RepID=UPI001E448937|nr:hypothetical protein [Micromonospora okii]